MINHHCRVGTVIIKSGAMDARRYTSSLWDKLQNRSPLKGKLGSWDCGHLVDRSWNPYYFLSKYFQCLFHLCVRLPDSLFFRGILSGKQMEITKLVSTSFPFPCSPPIWELQDNFNGESTLFSPTFHLVIGSFLLSSNDIWASFKVIIFRNDQNIQFP